MKQRAILKYKTQLTNYSDQNLLIPLGHEEEFWEWFNMKSRLFDNSKINLSLRNIKLSEINEGYCFKNSYRIANAYCKNQFYYEGFCFLHQDDSCIKHAFNVGKRGRVNDYTVGIEKKSKYDYYVGVKIPLSFVRRFYKSDKKNSCSQYALLVSYFLYSNKIDNYMNYLEP
ncbi:MAG: hypothetical protein ACOYOT_11990 [Bacteroidales bacterium]